ncbi:V4R domain-containing protein [Aquibacillus saliphilus]|uniref:V4R domain-containing protein n=1 Tax=Aquibacillus saliphilus TaxID=1909422 RepID=UPI001CEFD190|nr:V4R domain-containing protein [Aquibacillus saliphilus]
MEINDIFQSSDLIFSSESFGLLRETLYQNIGEKRAEIFLIQFGDKLGQEKAIKLKQHHTDKDELVRQATLTHVKLGHVSEVKSSGTTVLNKKGEFIFIDAIGQWIDSFEADLHIHNHGKSDTCVCHILSGFASGFLSEIYETDIYVVELTCKAMGYPHCTFEVNTKKHWLQVNPSYIEKFNHQTVAKELEITYDKLLYQKQLLEKITYFHSQLTECVAKENSIHDVLDTAYTILKIPIIIKNIQTNKIIALKGMDETTYANLLSQHSETERISEHNETILEKSGAIHIMTTPIYLNDKVFARCTFIYEDTKYLDNNGFLFLERLATVSALCFLKDKISFETIERLKISLLDRLIHEQYESKDDFETHLHLVSNKIKKPYLSLVIRCNHKNYLPIDHYDQLLQFSQTFKYYYLDGLFTKNHQEIYILLSTSTHPNIEKLLLQILNQMQENNPDLTYTLGISNEFNQLEFFSEYLKQAKQAVSLPRNKQIAYYSELGLLGNFLENINTETLKQTASEQLKGLLNTDSNMKELLHTLYIYLINGKNFKKTMDVLNLSMGGVQYRVRKIEEITQIDLKESYTSSYLLLLIESLIIMKEIKL